MNLEKPTKPNKAATGDLMTKIAASSFILLVASVGITALTRVAFRF